jgi:glutathione S-transferase
MPESPMGRAKVRLFNKLIDEYVHNSCTILSYAIAFRAGMLQLSPEAREAAIAKAPSKKRTEYKRDVLAHGLDSNFVTEALEHHQKLLAWIDNAMEDGPYLAGGKYSLADVAVIPYISRLELLRLERFWEQRKGVQAWWARVRERASTRQEIFDRMTVADAAPFKTIDPEPWPKVRELVKAA